MNLENYWKVLANSDYEKAAWSFFNNGWFAAKTQKDLLIFGKDGNLFATLDRKTNIYDMENGWIAVGSWKDGRWKFYGPQDKCVMETWGGTTPLRFGYYAEHLPSGETYLVSLDEPENRINLGYQVVEVQTGLCGRFAYAQMIRHKMVWHLCQVKNGQVVTNEHRCDILKVEVLADGSYILHFQNHTMRLYNSLGSRVFSCNKQKVNYHIVGKRQIFAYNGRAYQGVYNTVDGALLLSAPEVKIYWESGAYYTPAVGLVFSGYNGLLSSKYIYQCRRFTDECAVVCFRGKTFVIEVEQPLADLRRQICNKLTFLQKKEACYAAYLKDFLAMIA